MVSSDLHGLLHPCMGHALHPTLSTCNTTSCWCFTAATSSPSFARFPSLSFAFSITGLPWARPNPSIWAGRLPPMLKQRLCGLSLCVTCACVFSVSDFSPHISCMDVGVCVCMRASLCRCVCSRARTSLLWERESELVKPGDSKSPQKAGSGPC